MIRSMLVHLRGRTHDPLLVYGNDVSLFGLDLVKKVQFGSGMSYFLFIWTSNVLVHGLEL